MTEERDGYELFTIEDFLQQVSYGAFNEYDGTGYLGTKDVRSPQYFDFLDINRMLRVIKMDGFTHVYWYNK